MIGGGNTNAVQEVHYLQFLTRYRVAFDAGSELSVAGWETAVWSRLMDALLQGRASGRVAGYKFMNRCLIMRH